MGIGDISHMERFTISQWAARVGRPRRTIYREIKAGLKLADGARLEVRSHPDRKRPRLSIVIDEQAQA
jgi:hypothetical protein